MARGSSDPSMDSSRLNERETCSPGRESGELERREDVSDVVPGRAVSLGSLNYLRRLTSRRS